LLCLCHACDFDLRQANAAPYIPYDIVIQHMLVEIAVHIAGQNTDINPGYLDALHQFCKVMVSRRTSAHLAVHVAEALGILDLRITRGRQAFELRPIHERHHIIQLSAWLLADPHKRLTDAWQAKAIRCNYLTRDFNCMPPWYAALTDSFRRKRH
jgi:hypothetical protein